MVATVGSHSLKRRSKRVLLLSVLVGGEVSVFESIALADTFKVFKGSAYKVYKLAPEAVVEFVKAEFVVFYACFNSFFEVISTTNHYAHFVFHFVVQGDEPAESRGFELVGFINYK